MEIEVEPYLRFAGRLYSVVRFALGFLACQALELLKVEVKTASSMLNYE